MPGLALAAVLAGAPLCAEEALPEVSQPGMTQESSTLELDASAIRGSQELPRVLHIVPWKEPGLAALAGRPINSLLDEVLGPVDREVFRRQLRYFNQLYVPEGESGPVRND